MTIAHEHLTHSAETGHETELFFDATPRNVAQDVVQSNNELLFLAYEASNPSSAIRAIDAISDIDHARRLQAYADMYEKYSAVLSSHDATSLKATIRDDAYRLLSRRFPFQTVERIGVPSVEFGDAAADAPIDFRDVIALAQIWEVVDRDIVIAKGFPYIFEKMASNPHTSHDADSFETAFIASLRNGHPILTNRSAILNQAEAELEHVQIPAQERRTDQGILAIATEHDKKRRAEIAARLSKRALVDTQSSLPITKSK
jgi:hypothetical protein